MNLIKTTMLLTVMTMLFMGVGYMIGGRGGMLIALVIAAGTNVFAWWNSGNMVLRMHNALEVDETNAPELVQMVEQLSQNAGIPTPRTYILETDQPNAFATGRSPEHGAVAVSRGLMDRLTSEEVAAVVAHELAHIRSRDTLTMTITATLAGAIGMLVNFGFFFRGSGGNNNPFGMIGMLAAMILAPLAAGIVQMAVSRTREYEADKDGAEICGNPLWLAGALRKIEAYAKGVINMPAERAKGTAHMFIINPLNAMSMDGLFSTHPATANRIAALEEMNQAWRAEHHAEQLAAERAANAPRPEFFGRDAGEMRKPDRHSGPWGETGTQTIINDENVRKGPWG